MRAGSHDAVDGDGGEEGHHWPGQHLPVGTTVQDDARGDPADEHAAGEHQHGDKRLQHARAQDQAPHRRNQGEESRVNRPLHPAHTLIRLAKDQKVQPCDARTTGTRIRAPQDRKVKV